MVEEEGDCKSCDSDEVVQDGVCVPDCSDPTGSTYNATMTRTVNGTGQTPGEKTAHKATDVSPFPYSPLPGVSSRLYL